jgi:hypothetical protein
MNFHELPPRLGMSTRSHRLRVSAWRLVMGGKRPFTRVSGVTIHDVGSDARVIFGGANQRTAREKEASLGWKAQATKRAKWRSSTSIGRREQTLLGAEDVGRLGSRPSGPRPGFVAVHSLL